MNEKIILEIKRINQLMGVISINEQPLGLFSRVGLKESIIIVKNQADELINLFKKGYIDAVDLKKQMQKNIDEYKIYLDDSIYNKIKQELDDLVTNTNLNSNADNVGDILKTKLDDLEKTLDDLKKNIDIELKSFENGVRKRFTEWLDNYTNTIGSGKIIESVEILNNPSPIPGGGTIGDNIIKVSDNESAVDDFLTDAVIEHDMTYKKIIDADKNLSIESKTKLKALIDETEFIRIENLKQKIRENPKFNEKFRSNTNHLEEYYNKILNKPREKRTASEQRFLNEYHKVRSKSMTPDELKQMNDLYDVAKKSSSFEYRSKVKILTILGPEWLQYIKMLIESFAGFRRSADDWAKEAEKSAQILFDELDANKFTEVTQLKAWKSDFNSKVKQFKNEMQLSVSDWSKKNGYDFDAIWTDMKTKMKELASKNEDKTAVASVDSLIAKCQERNFKGNIITRNFPGWGGWKSIGDILDLTKNNIENLPPKGYIEPATRTSSLNLINNTLIQLKNLAIKLKTEFNDLSKNFGFTEALDKFKNRKIKLGDKTLWYQKVGNFLRFVFVDLSRIWIRKMFSGQYFNVDVLISKLSSRGISKKTPGFAFPQLIPRLLSLTVLINSFTYLLDPVRDLVGDLVGWFGEAIIQNIPGLKEFMTASKINVDYVGNFSEEAKEFINMYLSPEKLLENFTVEFGLDPIKAKLLFFDFALLPQLISDNIIYNKDQLQAQIDENNTKLDEEFQKWDNNYKQKFNAASPEEQKKLKEESVGTAFLAMNQMKTRSQKTAMIEVMKQKNSNLCANFDINKFNYIIKNTEYTTGPQPLVLQAIIKENNEYVGENSASILKKYVNEPEMAITDINKVVEKSKNVVDGEISKNNGVVALLKGSDGKKYSLFTDGDLFFYKPPYDEIITTLKAQKYIKEGDKMVLSRAGENFKMESKHICEFPFP